MTTQQDSMRFASCLVDVYFCGPKIASLCVQAIVFFFRCSSEEENRCIRNVVNVYSALRCAIRQCKKELVLLASDKLQITPLSLNSTVQFGTKRYNSRHHVLFFLTLLLRRDSKLFFEVTSCGITPCHLSHAKLSFKPSTPLPF
jgi:hypothetical protein